MNKLLKISPLLVLGALISGVAMATPPVVHTSATINYRICGKTYQGTANGSVNVDPIPTLVVLDFPTSYGPGSPAPIYVKARYMVGRVLYMDTNSPVSFSVTNIPDGCSLATPNPGYPEAIWGVHALTYINGEPNCNGAQVTATWTKDGINYIGTGTV